jgi:hypothetical protein
MARRTKAQELSRTGPGFSDNGNGGQGHVAGSAGSRKGSYRYSQAGGRVSLLLHEAGSLFEAPGQRPFFVTSRWVFPDIPSFSLAGQTYPLNSNKQKRAARRQPLVILIAGGILSATDTRWIIS